MRHQAWRVAAVVAAALAGATSAPAAFITNGSFETSIVGQIPGWTVTGATSINTQPESEVNITIAPQISRGNPVLFPEKSSDGSPTGAETFWRPTNGARFAILSGLQANVPVTISQTFTAGAGSVVRFNVFFDAYDNPAFDTDSALVTISRLGVPTTLYTTNLATVGNYGNDGFPNWRTITYTLPANGTYTLTFSQTDGTGEPLFRSRLGVDNVDVITPAPMTLVAGLVGFVGVGGILRRRK